MRYGMVMLMALLLVGVRALPALAHAAPISLEPRGGSTLGTSPEALRLEFSQPVELKFSRVEVRSGRQVISDREALHLEGGRTLVQPLPPLASGRYDVKWRVLSTDGHVTEGSYWFKVEHGAAAAPAQAAGAAAAERQAPARDWGLIALLLLVAAPLVFTLATERGSLRW